MSVSNSIAHLGLGLTVSVKPGKRDGVLVPGPHRMCCFNSVPLCPCGRPSRGETNGTRSPRPGIIDAQKAKETE